MSTLIRSYSLIKHSSGTHGQTHTTHISTSASIYLSPPYHHKVECAHIFTHCAALSVMNMIIGPILAVWPINILSTSRGPIEVR